MQLKCITHFLSLIPTTISIRLRYRSDAMYRQRIFLDNITRNILTIRSWELLPLILYHHHKHPLQDPLIVDVVGCQLTLSRCLFNWAHQSVDTAKCLCCAAERSSGVWTLIKSPVSAWPDLWKVSRTLISILSTSWSSTTIVLLCQTRTPARLPAPTSNRIHHGQADSRFLYYFVLCVNY